jgi:predicted AlkP superfamily pyrophosphatase or phosphodiesterase
VARRAFLIVGVLVVLAMLVDLVRRPRPHEERAPIAKAQPAPKPAPAKPPAPPPAPQRVLIISEDGLRPDVLGPELTPRHVELLREGTSATLARTIPESDTLPSHASMLSGVGAAAHGLMWNSYQAGRGYIHVPTIFSAAKKAGLSTAMIVGKPKLRHIALPGSVDHFERPSYLCGGVAKRAAAYFTQAKPDLMFVHFSDPDEYGHSHGWMSDRYLSAVRSSDACLATLLAAVDASGLAGTTLVIVTADHGGHGKRHSSGHHFEIDREIPWIVRGPGVEPGMRLDHPVETVDTAATTLAALGLPPLPNMLGASRLTFAR